MMAARCAVHFWAYPSGAFRPVPMAVRAQVDLEDSARVRRRRAMSSPSVTAKAPNSWPSVIGTASCSCVRPILTRRRTPRALARERRDQLAHGRRPEPRVAEQQADVQRGRVDVVGRLRRVDVVVRVAVLVLALRVAQQLERAVGDHLVGVHVGRGAGAALDHVDDELLVQLAVDDLLARLARCRGDSRLNRPSCGWRGPRPS